MEITVDRQKGVKTDQATTSHVYIDGQFQCYGLEPVDRGLTNDMPLNMIAAIKVPYKTAVPTGRYQLTKYFSPKHNANVPLLLNVPGFDFVEIHTGNFPQDTDACLLLGTQIGINQVLNSRVAIGAFYPKFFAALDRGEKVFITYK